MNLLNPSLPKKIHPSPLLETFEKVRESPQRRALPYLVSVRLAVVRKDFFKGLF